jgi:hypothetical protein
LILISKRFSKFPNIVVIFLIQYKKRVGGFIIKPYKQNKIEFISNSFVFKQYMQDDRSMMMKDVKMTRKRKEQTILISEIFLGRYTCRAVA